ncbi:hypothetical protein EON83_15345 [bacterium]|nr:MAG: hypothetical protein EON83_15345 [bacterium]
MEFEDVNEEFELEARRVAAAFGLRRCSTLKIEDILMIEGIGDQRIHVEAHIVILSNEWRFLAIRNLEEPDEECRISWGRLDDSTPPTWGYAYSLAPTCIEPMVRGLYCLGVEDKEEQLLLSINSPLSAHEKLELRLSMPREFWPQSWMNADCK